MPRLNEAGMRGCLIIYVDGYRMVSKNTVHIFSDGKVIRAIPRLSVTQSISQFDISVLPSFNS